MVKEHEAIVDHRNDHSPEHVKNQKASEALAQHVLELAQKHNKPHDATHLTTAEKKENQALFEACHKLEVQLHTSGALAPGLHIEGVDKSGRLIIADHNKGAKGSTGTGAKAEHCSYVAALAKDGPNKGCYVVSEKSVQLPNKRWEQEKSNAGEHQNAEAPKINPNGDTQPGKVKVTMNGGVPDHIVTPDATYDYLLDAKTWQRTSHGQTEDLGHASVAVSPDGRTVTISGGDKLPNPITIDTAEGKNRGYVV